MFDMAHKIEEIKKARQQKSEDQRRAMEEEIKRLEEALDNERDNEALREAEKEAEMEADRKRKKQEKEEADKVFALVTCL